MSDLRAASLLALDALDRIQSAGRGDDQSAKAMSVLIKALNRDAKKNQKTMNCHECSHFNVVLQFCNKGFRPNFVLPKDGDYGWKRRCGEFEKR